MCYTGSWKAFKVTVHLVLNFAWLVWHVQCVERVNDVLILTPLPVLKDSLLSQQLPGTFQVRFEEGEKWQIQPKN